MASKRVQKEVAVSRAISEDSPNQDETDLRQVEELFDEGLDSLNE